jgi:tetratricopeptide (TPR) repeat protein
MMRRSNPQWAMVFAMVMAALATTVAAWAQTTPQTHNEYMEVAKAAQEKGDHAQALVLFDKAIQMRQDSKEARYGKIISQDALGNYKAIIETAGQIIKIDPNDPNAYYIRGTAYIQLQPYTTGNYKKANKDLSFAIEKRPDFDSAYINRGLSWAGQKKFKEAIDDISQAIKIKETADAYRARATVYRLQGKEDLAQADDKKAFQLGG